MDIHRTRRALEIIQCLYNSTHTLEPTDTTGADSPDYPLSFGDIENFKHVLQTDIDAYEKAQKPDKYSQELARSFRNRIGVL